MDIDNENIFSGNISIYVILSLWNYEWQMATCLLKMRLEYRFRELSLITWEIMYQTKTIENRLEIVVFTLYLIASQNSLKLSAPSLTHHCKNHVFAE